MNNKLKVGSDFSGVGALNQALKRLGIDYEEVFACDMDKYARQTFIHNYGEPKYYPTDVYEREIPIEPLDLYVSSPPCQAFSLAGKRKGEEDKRGILFYNSHEFIMKNNPRYFIFENVKGLLSDSDGSTFNRWIEYLGGKSVNGMATMFPYDHSAPYHIYWEVLNAKDYNVPQNRERVFIVGIRDDADNDFRFPKPERLTKRLKDVLESYVDEKYYLSEKMVESFTAHGERHKEKGTGFQWQPKTFEDVANCIRANAAICPTDNTIKIPSATSKEYDNPKVKFQLTGGKWDKTHEQSGRVYDENGISPTIHTMQGGGQEPKIAIGAIRGRNIDNPKSRESGLPTQQQLEINENGTSNKLTTVQKYNVVIQINPSRESGGKQPYQQNRVYDSNGISTTLCRDKADINITQDFRIRKLTPREAFRLMDFNEDFIERTLNYKKNFYFQFVYSKFDINKKETLCNAKLKVVKDTQTPKNLETCVLCTTKECQKMDALTTLKQKREMKTENNENPLNVNFAIEVLGELERKECATNTIKWTDCTETLYMLMKEGKNQVVKDISEIQKDSSCIEKSLKITLEENLSEEKLFITLILLKQIMTSKIYTYVKMPLNTQRFISSTVVYEKKSERLLLSYLKMEYTEQVVSDSMLYKQAGNSVVVKMYELLIKKLLKLK